MSYFNCRFMKTSFMKSLLLSVFVLVCCLSSKATSKDSTVMYDLPDSVKAVQFMAEINVQSLNNKKLSSAGIRTDIVTLSLKNYGGKRRISFNFPAYSEIMARGIGVRADIRAADMEFAYDWENNTTYKLLIATTSDSAQNFSLYSGYIFLPKENKWKLIGTCKITRRWNTLQSPAFFTAPRKKGNMLVNTGQVWIQRNTGSWKNMKADGQSAPVINLYPHIDSVQQRQIYIKLIGDAITSAKTDVKDNVEGVYYKMIKEGTGKQVSVNDTVTIFYKGYLFANDSVFDQTTDKPATFPLKRLIKAWQIGVPLCRVGGKIKLVIPSDMAYSIRTRAAKIPPNSILVFEIEVLDTKSQ